MKRWIVFLFLASTHVSWGQKLVQLNNNKLVKKLYETPNDQINITHGNFKNTLIKITDQKQVGYIGSFIKKKDGLYYFLNGTGRLYKTEKTGDSSFAFRRIDSTHFYGYNGASIPFAYNDTIFSLGGNGFWRINGHLRHFSTNSHEWNITTINEEVPTIYANYFQDFDDNKLFYVQYPYYDPVINKNYESYTLYELDLKSKQNRKLGILNSHLTNLMKIPGINFYTLIVPSLGGTVVFLNLEEAFLFNYKDGTVYKLTKKTIIDEIYGRSDGQNVTDMFADKDSVFYVLSGDSTYTLHSFRLSKDDFIKLDYPLYTSENIFSWQAGIGIGAILLLIFGLSYFILYKKRNSAKSNSHSNSITQDNQTEILSYKPLELELIQMIISHGEENKNVLVEDINSVLGLSKKGLEIQKKVRTETINRINHKFRVLNDVEEDLIVRVRLENDKRYYRYFITNEFVKLLRTQEL